MKCFVEFIYRSMVKYREISIDFILLKDFEALLLIIRKRIENEMFFCCLFLTW